MKKKREHQTHTCQFFSKITEGSGLCQNEKVKHNHVSLGYCSKCPFYLKGEEETPESFRKRFRLGDVAERHISKIPYIKKLPCYDENGKLKPDSPCGKRKRKWNGET